MFYMALQLNNFSLCLFCKNFKTVMNMCTSSLRFCVTVHLYAFLYNYTIVKWCCMTLLMYECKNVELYIYSYRQKTIIYNCTAFPVFSKTVKFFYTTVKRPDCFILQQFCTIVQPHNYSVSLYYCTTVLYN